MSIDEAEYKLKNSQLEKDLGVTHDPTFNAKHYIYEITHKASKILGILMQTSSYTKIHFQCYVNP